jgi:hypothetical protein
MGKRRSLNDINTIVLHCSDTPNGRAHSVEDIDLWHGQRNPSFKRNLSIDPHHNPELKHIGYHYVITLDGRIYSGRPLTETGAHVSGHNANTVGVCLIGRDQFTLEQFEAINKVTSLIESMTNKTLKIKGHNEYSKSKTCPGFNVQEFLHNGYYPAAKNIYIPKQPVEDSETIEPKIEHNKTTIKQPLTQPKKQDKPMSVLAIIAGLFKPAADLIDNLHTSTEEEMKLKNELVLAQNQITTQVINLEAKLLQAQSSIIVAEAKSQSWIARNWRPITMLTFLVLIICDAFGLTEFRLSEQAWDLLKIGIGGYVVGRSAEKIMPNVMKAIGK